MGAVRMAGMTVEEMEAATKHSKGGMEEMKYKGTRGMEGQSIYLVRVFALVGERRPSVLQDFQETPRTRHGLSL